MPSSSKTTVQGRTGSPGTAGALAERKARPGMKESDCIAPLFSRYTRRQGGRLPVGGRSPLLENEPATDTDRTPATPCRAASPRVSDRVPMGGESAGALTTGLPLRAVRTGDVGAAVAAGGLLYHLREPER